MSGVDFNLDELSVLFNSQIEIETNSEIQPNIMAEALKKQMEDLQAALSALTVRFEKIEKPTVVEPYKDEIPLTTKATLSSIKSLPEFHGITTEYPSWRNLITTAMKYIDKEKDDGQVYLDALLLIKAKIRGPAAAILSNHATPLNLAAIIDRLDYSYADQRAMYVIEQELIVLQQGRMSVHEFYDKINEKLNMIITKIHMSHKEPAVADALIDNMREKALRTFITGLSNNVGHVLYSSNPKTLADAYARLQTILSDRDRMSFATQYNRNEASGSNYNHRNRSELNQSHQVDHKLPLTKNRMQSQSNTNDQRKPFEIQRQFNPNFTPKNESPFVNKQPFAMKPTSMSNVKHEPMEIDKSSMNVNVDNKRRFQPDSMQYSRQHKFQRVNNIENAADDDCDETNEIDDTQSEASIFLDL